MKTSYPLCALLGAGLLMAAAITARADEDVTFQVDMSRFTNSSGVQAASLVDVRGAFNGWAEGWTLYNNGANVYTNTFTVIGLASDQLEYKFTYTTCAGTQWEDDNPPPGTGANRVLQLVGAPQTLPVVPFYKPSVTSPLPNLVNANITFQVDLTAQVETGNFLPGFGDTITVTGGPGALTSWGDGVSLTNDPALPGNQSNIYSAVISMCGTPGTLGAEFKFRMNGGWEDTLDGSNRRFTFTGSDQVLPVYQYFDQPPGAVTNANVTFQVDMTPQVITGGFTNGLSTVTVSGIFNGWGAGDILTNNPALPGNASNIYSTTLSIAVPMGVVPTTTVGLWARYKFRADGGWETANIHGVGNNKDRLLFYTGGDQVLPLVTYSDASSCDLVPEDVLVTVILHITNGTPDMNGVPFDSANDVIYLNGDFIGWNAAGGYWTTALPQMTNNPPGSDYYQQTFILPRGSSRGPKFKFGLSGPTHANIDNEAAGGEDHQAWVRSYGSTYTLPVAQFGSQFASTRVEPQWGNLMAGPAAGGVVPITWLGLPCITLQTRSDLTSGSWVDLPATDATSSTNWPNTGDMGFFRLQKRPQP